MSYGGEQEKATQVQAQQGLKPMFVADGVIPLPRPLKGNGSITPAQPSRMDACFQYTTDQLRQVELRLDSLRDRLCPVLSQGNTATQSESAGLPAPASPLEAQVLGLCGRLVALEQILEDIHARLQV